MNFSNEHKRVECVFKNLTQMFINLKKEKYGYAAKPIILAFNIVIGINIFLLDIV